MINVKLYSEYGVISFDYNHGHRVNSRTYQCIDAYKQVPENEDWSSCPCCGMKPRIWVFDNGRSTGCGCGNSNYDHFGVHAESIMSVHRRCNGRLEEYHRDELRKNWNEYCATMVNPCSHGDLFLEGRW